MSRAVVIPLRVARAFVLPLAVARVFVGGVTDPAPGVTFYILQETGDLILTESLNKLRQE